jgi:hypothetical protein
VSIFVRDIRRAIAALIRARRLKDLAPEHVYTNRVRPYNVERMPCVCVFSTIETGDRGDDAPRVNNCEVEISIAVYMRTVAREDTDEDDLLDDYLQEIRNELGANETIDDNAQNSQYAGCDWILTNEGEFAMGAGILRYKVTYREEQPGPDGSNLSNLRRVHVDYDGAPKADGKIDAEDDVLYD